VTSPPRASGVLILVGTPLGNREDLSPRARRAILEADLLLCEDTRSPSRLLGEGERLPPRLSCFAGNEEDRIGNMLDALAQGRTVAFISEAGMPVWSDPGRALVEAAVAAGHDVDVVPGPTAAATALALTGFAARGARFLGFPPRDGGTRHRFVQSVAEDLGVSIIYEAGPRVPALLAELAAALEDAGTRKAVVARELTKMHQEVLRGTVAELAESIVAALRGEVTVVIEGRAAAPDDEREARAREVLDIVLADLKPRDKAKRLAPLTGLDAQAIYAKLAR
jgi:16S rRNA (cytidine1402-2'-O)-methyltransferase